MNWTLTESGRVQSLGNRAEFYKKNVWQQGGYGEKKKEKEKYNFTTKASQNKRRFLLALKIPQTIFQFFVNLLLPLMLLINLNNECVGRCVLPASFPENYDIKTTNPKKPKVA